MSTNHHQLELRSVGSSEFPDLEGWARRSRRVADTAPVVVGRGGQLVRRFAQPEG